MGSTSVKILRVRNIIMDVVKSIGDKIIIIVLFVH